MISIIITAYNEAQSIKKAISCLADIEYSGINDYFEIIQVSPDEQTLDAGVEAKNKLELSNAEFTQIKDPKKGKPFALNLALKKAKGEILVLTDGDVYFEKDAIKLLIDQLKCDDLGGITGRPKSSDPKSTMMGYLGNLLADAAHHKRMLSMRNDSNGKSKLLVTKNTFFPLSGYIMAIRNIGIDLPEDVLADDAYISYKIFNSGLKLGYSPEAISYVKYPKTISDYLKQKKRSLGGYIQLWKYNIVKQSTKSRSFWHELQYFWFPFKYATTPKELLWSLMLYPIRLYTWISIWWERKIIKKDFSQTWVRVESTK